MPYNGICATKSLNANLFYPNANLDFFHSDYFRSHQINHFYQRNN